MQKVHYNYNVLLGGVILAIALAIGALSVSLNTVGDLKATLTPDGGGTKAASQMYYPSAMKNGTRTQMSIKDRLNLIMKTKKVQPQKMNVLQMSKNSARSYQSAARRGSVERAQGINGAAAMRLMNANIKVTSAKTLKAVKETQEGITQIMGKTDTIIDLLKELRGLAISK